MLLKTHSEKICNMKLLSMKMLRLSNFLFVLVFEHENAHAFEDSQLHFVALLSKLYLIVSFL